ncbi:MAG TPA: FCD domain-containing protein [Steroidobacteraceae bacterium]
MPSHDQIAAVLGTEILRGIHRAGDNMPPEPALIRRFRVSRTVMREVTKTLAAKGFVISKRRIGTRVRDPVHWNYFDADVLAWRVRMGLDAQFLRSLTEIRRALEPAAAALAARRRTPADIAMLRRHVSDMARPSHTRQSFAESDLAFHREIGVASGNLLIRSVGSVIEAALVASFRYSSPIDRSRNQAAAVHNHAAIVAAIEARDAEAAAQAMLRVINLGARRIAMKRKRGSGL